jgi:hypothetical protein
LNIMSYSFTATETKTFTLTHAKHLAAKVSADLKRVQRLYGHVTDERIAEFEGEVTELLRQGYLGTVTYGFQRNDMWIEPTLRYTAADLAGSGGDDDPGRASRQRHQRGTFPQLLDVQRGLGCPVSGPTCGNQRTVAVAARKRIGVCRQQRLFRR